MVSSLTARVLGQRVRQLRTRRGLTQQDLAGDDYSKSYISAIEQGKTRPSLEALQRIASRLDVPAGTLLDPDAPGFAPFDPEAMPRRVRRRRGVRAGAPGGIPEPAQLDLQLAEAELMVYMGQPAVTLQIIRPLLPDEEGEPTKAPRLLDSTQLQKAYYLAAVAAIRTGDATEALVHVQKGMQLAMRLGDRDTLERMRNILGLAYYHAGQPLSALDHHRACLDAIQAGAVNDPNLKMLVYSNMAADYRALHENERATSTYRSAIEMLDEVNSVEKQAAAFWQLSTANAAVLNYTTARQYAAKALSLYEALDNIHLMAQMENRYGDMLIETGDLSGAELYLNRGLKLAEDLNSDLDRGRVLANLARISLNRGDVEEAQTRIDQAIESSRRAAQAGEQNGSQNGNSDRRPKSQAQGRTAALGVLSRALVLAGEIAHQRGDRAAAEKSFTEAIDIINGNEAVEGSNDIYERYAHVLAEWGQHEQAYRALARRKR